MWTRTLKIYHILFLVAEQGKLATGEIPLHDGEHLKWIHRILMGAYLLITNVLLINLLIAIFRYHVLYQLLCNFIEDNKFEKLTFFLVKLQTDILLEITYSPIHVFFSDVFRVYSSDANFIFVNSRCHF